MIDIAVANTGGVSKQIEFSKPAEKDLRGKDRVVNIDHVWRTKNRSVPPFEHERVCVKHLGLRRVNDTMRDILDRGYPANPSNRVHIGSYSDPPNRDFVSPNPNKRFNKEYRKANVVSGIPPNTADFYVKN